MEPFLHIWYATGAMTVVMNGVFAAVVLSQRSPLIGGYRSILLLQSIADTALGCSLSVYGAELSFHPSGLLLILSKTSLLLPPRILLPRVAHIGIVFTYMSSMIFVALGFLYRLLLVKRHSLIRLFHAPRMIALTAVVCVVINTEFAVGNTYAMSLAHEQIRPLVSSDSYQLQQLLEHDSVYFFAVDFNDSFRVRLIGLDMIPVLSMFVGMAACTAGILAEIRGGVISENARAMQRRALAMLLLQALSPTVFFGLPYLMFLSPCFSFLSPYVSLSCSVIPMLNPTIVILMTKEYRAALSPSRILGLHKAEAATVNERS